MISGDGEEVFGAKGPIGEFATALDLLEHALLQTAISEQSRAELERQRAQAEAEKEALPLPLGELKGVAEASTDGEARLESDGEGVSDGEGDEDVEGPSERVGDAV